ncbi:hypothetical protein JTE90_005341 [Oedothorax gibbosus]|uniref:Uncharacterized protein n=1 Tax=Oedothorax gibbosus TaxID=931172 RepID=A0AAV6TFK2_9ARAC|nr:hypothetical protein JTE90_005341 [Oedothorax gibbosus]
MRNCNRQSPAQKRFNGLPIPVGKGKHTMIPSMWQGVWPRTSRSLQTCYCSASCAKRRQSSKKKRRTRNDPSVYLVARASSVIRINQTNHYTNQERPCTTTHEIKKELLICQSSPCPGLVGFAALSQIEPQAPLLVVTLRQFLKFQLCNHTSPGTQKLWFPGSCPACHLRNTAGSLAGIVYG